MPRTSTGIVGGKYLFGQYAPSSNDGVREEQGGIHLTCVQCHKEYKLPQNITLEVALEHPEKFCTKCKDEKKRNKKKKKKAE